MWKPKHDQVLESLSQILSSGVHTHLLTLNMNIKQVPTGILIQVSQNLENVVKKHNDVLKIICGNSKNR